MTYGEAVSYILDIPKFTKKNDAEHTKLFLQYLGDPQHSYKVIHVAGTNGKGSVCAYLDAMLRAEGNKTGLFTSPHLVAVNERIAVNGAPVSDDDFVRLFETALDAARRMEAAGFQHPTFFEFLLGMALCAFRDADVDYAVLETGLGGRLDATSAVEPPEVCVITSIGYDHMQYLGDTLVKMARRRRPGSSVRGCRYFTRRPRRKATALSAGLRRTTDVSVKKSGKTRTKSLEPGTNILHFPVPVIIMEIPRGN